MVRKNKKILSSLTIFFILFSPNVFANQGVCSAPSNWSKFEPEDIDRIKNLKEREHDSVA